MNYVVMVVLLVTFQILACAINVMSSLKPFNGNKYALDRDTVLSLGRYLTVYQYFCQICTLGAISHPLRVILGWHLTRC